MIVHLQYSHMSSTGIFFLCICLPVVLGFCGKTFISVAISTAFWNHFEVYSSELSLKPLNVSAAVASDT